MLSQNFFPHIKYTKESEYIFPQLSDLIELYFEINDNKSFGKEIKLNVILTPKFNNFFGINIFSVMESIKVLNFSNNIFKISSLVKFDLNKFIF